MGTDITSKVPVPAEFPTENERKAAEKALEYMGLTPGTPMSEIDRSIMCLSVLAQTDVLKIFAQPPEIAKAIK